MTLPSQTRLRTLSQQAMASRSSEHVSRQAAIDEANARIQRYKEELAAQEALWRSTSVKDERHNKAEAKMRELRRSLNYAEKAAKGIAEKETYGSSPTERRVLFFAEEPGRKESQYAYKTGSYAYKRRRDMGISSSEWREMTPEAKAKVMEQISGPSVSTTAYEYTTSGGRKFVGTEEFIKSKVSQDKAADLQKRYTAFKEQYGEGTAADFFPRQPSLVEQPVVRQSVSRTTVKEPGLLPFFGAGQQEVTVTNPSTFSILLLTGKPQPDYFNRYGEIKYTVSTPSKSAKAFSGVYRMNKSVFDKTAGKVVYPVAGKLKDYYVAAEEAESQRIKEATFKTDPAYATLRYASEGLEYGGEKTFAFGRKVTTTQQPIIGFWQKKFSSYKPSKEFSFLFPKGSEFIEEVKTPIIKPGFTSGYVLETVGGTTAEASRYFREKPVTSVAYLATTAYVGGIPNTTKAVPFLARGLSRGLVTATGAMKAEEFRFRGTNPEFRSYFEQPTFSSTVGSMSPNDLTSIFSRETYTLRNYERQVRENLQRRGLKGEELERGVAAFVGEKRKQQRQFIYSWIGSETGGNILGTVGTRASSRLVPRMFKGFSTWTPRKQRFVIGATGTSLGGIAEGALASYYADVVSVRPVSGERMVASGLFGAATSFVPGGAYQWYRGMPVKNVVVGNRFGSFGFTTKGFVPETVNLGVSVLDQPAEFIGDVATERFLKYPGTRVFVPGYSQSKTFDIGGFTTKTKSRDVSAARSTLPSVVSSKSYTPVKVSEFTSRKTFTNVFTSQRAVSPVPSKDIVPSISPSNVPAVTPSMVPVPSPSKNLVPSTVPSTVPSVVPSIVPVIVPTFKFPTLPPIGGGRRSFGRERKKFQMKTYTPSAAALFLGIKATSVSKSSVKSGLNIRPILVSSMRKRKTTKVKRL